MMMDHLQRKSRQGIFCVAVWLWAAIPASLQANEILMGVHSFQPISETNTGQKQLELASELGLKVIRIGVSWRLMHEKKHGVPSWFWSRLDQVITLAENKGMKVILSVSETPCWASGDPNKICRADGNHSYNYRYPPADVNDYANAMQEIAWYFGNRVYAMEVWNEPNVVHFWPLHLHRNYSGFWPYPTPEEAFLIEVEAAANYARLLKATYTAIKHVNIGIVVLGGSLAGADTLYLKALYDAGIKGYFDALALHPYSAITTTGGVDGPADCNQPPWCFQKGVNEIRHLMLDVYGDDKPIWFTEYGVSSFSGRGGVTEQQQSEYFLESYDMLSQWDFVPVVIWYNLVDRDIPINREGGYGLYRLDYSLKPLGLAVQSKAATLAQNIETSPVAISPVGNINGQSIGYSGMTFLWKTIPGASSYFLWVNDYGTAENEMIPGRVQGWYNPVGANCQSSRMCRVEAGDSFRPGYNEWWIVAHFPDGTSRISEAGRFTIVPPGNRDSDADGISDFQDNCLYASNPWQRDTDYDGIGNRCDPDLNNDGRINQTDYYYFRLKIGTADQNADLNGDGIVNNFDEVMLRSELNGIPGPSCCNQ